jgi:hypothetical protein
MVLGDDGRIQWTSTAGGEATVTVSATLGDSTAAQSFVLISASPVPLASASIGAAGGLVKPAGDDPALAGVGISVPAGALSEVREISMATLAGAPAPAALAGAETTTPLLLEPTGTAFATPVRVTLKYPAALDAAAAAGELDAWLMDEATGDWDSAEVVQIDAVERLLTVEVNHFSVLVAGTNGFNLVLDVQDTTEVEGCVRSLTVKPALAQQLTEVPVTTALAKRPNLLTHPWDALADTSLAQLTSDPTSAGTLRVLWVAELLGNSGQVVGIDALAVSLEAFAGGAGRLVVARPDGSAGLIADIADRGADASFASIARGEGLTFRFKPPTPLDADPKLRVRVYFRADDDPAGQAPYLTTHQGAPLTEALGQVAATVALASGDADCDGVLDTIDPNVGTGTPEILQLPAATASVNVGDALNLACAAVGPAGADALTFTWTSTGSGDEFVPTTGSAGAPDGVAFTASTAGVRLVSCATAWQDAPLAAVFAVKVVKVAAPCGGGCDDANPCTKDICDQVSDTCVHAALMGPCEDGDPCTAGDTCGAGACQSGPAPDCDDGNPCTADACDAATGACAHTDQAGACEDGDLCTSGDACVGGVCVAGAPIACDDGKTCTDDQCDPGTGACATTPVSCPDGQLCQAGVGCAASPACTVDGDCAASEDGDACNGTLRCVGGACEIDPATVPAPCAASGDPCLVNVCDPGSGACVAQAAPGSPVCDDGEPCTVGDVCVAGACEPGAADGCDDADPCTIDICAPQTGCGHTAVACAEGESCDSVRGACEPEPECVTTDDCAAVEDGDLCNGTLACVDGECTLDAATVPAPLRPGRR